MRVQPNISSVKDRGILDCELRSRSPRIYFFLLSLQSKTVILQRNFVMLKNEETRIRRKYCCTSFTSPALLENHVWCPNYYQFKHNKSVPSINKKVLINMSKIIFLYMRLLKVIAQSVRTRRGAALDVLAILGAKWYFLFFNS